MAQLQPREMLSSRFLRRLLVAAILACATTAPLAQEAGHLPHADDFAALAKEARARRAPIVIAFVQASCNYCAIAKRDYLVPMHRDAKWREQIVMREVDLDRNAPFRDFNGAATFPSDFSRRYGVNRVPTVVVVNHRGELLAPPIVGLLTEDFYGFYLEEAIAAGIAKLSAAASQGGAGDTSR